MRCLAGLLVAVCLCGAADAALVTFTANLSGDQEVPSNSSAAFGSAILTLNTATNTYDINLTVFNMNPATLTPSPVHIHHAAVGVNGPVISHIWSLAGPRMDFGTFGFAYSGSNIGLDPSASAAILSGDTYINVHTQAFPPGEIRGQLINATAIPEPGTLLGLGLATVGFVGFRIRRRRLAS